MFSQAKTARKVAQVKERPLVSFLARPKPATQANNLQVMKIFQVSHHPEKKVGSTISLDGLSLPFSL